MPALYNLACDRLLPGRFAIVGIAMDEMTTEQFRAKMTERHQEVLDPEGLRRRRLGRVRRAAPLHAGQLQRPRRLRDGSPRSSPGSTPSTTRKGNIIFYMATPPSIFGMISEHIDAAGFKAREKRAGSGSSSRSRSATTSPRPSS